MCIRDRVRVPLNAIISRIVSGDVLELDSSNTLQDPLQDGRLSYIDGSPNTASTVCPAHYAVDVYFYEGSDAEVSLSLIHISEPTRLLSISYAVFCLKKKKNQ
eukprot:TRINITY_DN11244_c0_g1_i3.p1 TRINITY_DN11244_c0_g1~~TRINITY_DN11244_c0_g1_i3.p1  ORF type:complete len:103 (-),score=38.07 TRINITY_DN11244_c0_g1_i3:82-390(-)